MLFFLLVQAVAGPVLPAPRRPRSDKPCPVVANSADVVVCGRTDEPYRLRKLPTGVERADGLPKAEVGVFGNAKLAAEAERGADAQGGPINRAMVRLKIPLGGSKKQASP